MNLSGTGGTCVRPENEWDPTEDTELVENAFTALWNTVSSMQRSIGLDSLQNGPHIQLSGAQRYLYGLLAVYKLAVLHNSTIQSVTVGEGITNLTGYAFKNAKNLKSVSLPEGLTAIGYGAFLNCDQLTGLSLPNTVQTIGDFAFEGCSGLTELVLPVSLKSLGKNAFYKASSLKNVFFLGDAPTQTAIVNPFLGVTADAYYPNGSSTWTDAVRNSLGSGLNWKPSGNGGGTCGEKLYWLFDLDNGVLNITGTGNIQDCTGGAPWKALADGGTLYLFGSASVNANIDEAWQERVRHVVLREGAEHLNLDLTVFPGVTELTMPATVTDAAIYAGSSLERVHIPDFASWAKIDFRKDANPLCVAARLYTDGQRVTSFQLPAGAEKIGSYAFQGAKLDSLYIPDSVTSVGEGAFWDCRGMKITYAGSSEAWMRICTNCSLTVACQADGVTLCGFGSCGENLTWSITGDGTLVITGTGAMDDFGNDARAPWEDLEDDIKALRVEEGVTGIGECAFYGCGKLESVSLPSSLTEIRYSAFEYCSRLTSLVLPAKLETIGSRAFANCYGVESVFIPKSVTSIGRYAFDGCIPTTVTIEDLDSWCAIEFGGICANPISSITETLYLNGSNTPVTEITVPASVSDYAFQYCKVLKKVNIPAGAKIGADAFSGCTNAELYYGGTLEQWPETGYTSDIPVNFSDGTRVLGCGVTDPAGGHDNIRWVVSESGELRLSGEGELFLDDWGYENGSPWFRMTDRITSVVVEPGVTSLCAHTFCHLEHVTAIVIGPDVKTIAGGAFDQEGMSAAVIFQGCPAQIGPDNFTGQTLWAYYRPSDGWKSAQLGRYQATNLFWIPYTDQDAKYGSAAAVESDKILCAYDAKRNTICASIPDPDNTPRSGTYAFRYVVTLDDAAQTRLPSKTFKIKVESTVPTVKLRSGTLKLNTQQGAGAYDQTAVTVTGNTGLELVDLRTPNGWSSRDIRIAYDPQTGMLSAHLENEDAAVGTQSISLLPVVRRTDTGEDTVLRGNPVKVTVQVYSAKPSVSVSAKGKLDTIVPGSAITYTMRLKNLVGAVEAARLEGTDSQLFDVQPDAAGGSVVLTIAEGAQCSTKTTYKLNLIVQIGGQEYPIGISFRVSQSKLKCTASGAMTLFQSQSDPLTGRFTLASPAGVCVQSIAVSDKTDRNLLKAIGKCGLESPELLDGGVVEFNLGVANPGSLVKGKRYTLCLEITPAGNASDAAPTYLNLSVQVR